MNSISESSGLRKLLQSRPVTSFFVMAYLFSWIALIPYILSQWNILPKTKSYDIFFVVNSFVGPMLSAYIMLRIVEGKEAWKGIRKSIRQIKVGLKWYLFTLIIIPAAMFLGDMILNGGIPTFEGLTSKFFITYPIYFVLVFFGGGPLSEEIGWRGFALPRMQSKFGPLKATLFLSVLWSLWHLPHFLTVAQRGGPGSDLSLLYFNLPIFILLGIAISIILTWVFNLHHGNLFIVMLVHTSLNTFSLIQPYLTNPVLKNSDLSVTIGLSLLAFIILISTRGSLGYNKMINIVPVVKENMNR